MTDTVYREQWEEPGYRIREHTGAPPVDPTELRYTVNHYPGAKSIGGDPVTWFRAAQRAWVIARGYSLGYGWGYWPDGTEIEVRGWDYRNAANDVPDHPGDENRQSVALLLVVPGLGDAGQPATPAQVAAVQRRLREVHDRCGRELPNLVHGDLETTECAGAGVNRQTALGLFLPPIPDEENTDMMIAIMRRADWRQHPDEPWIAVSGGSAREATSWDVNTYADAHNVPIVDVPDVHQFDLLKRSAGLA